MSDPSTNPISPTNPLGRLRQRFLCFVFPQETPDLVIPPGENPHLWQARERIVTSMIHIAALVGIFSLFFTLPLFLSYGQPGVALVYTFTTVALWALALWPRLSHTRKVLVFMALFFFLGMSELLNYGYSIEGYIYLLVFVIGSTLFGGKKMGLLAFFLSLAAMITVGLLIVNGTFAPISLEPEKINYSFDSWLVSWIIFLLMSILVGSSSAQILGSLDGAWRREVEAMRQVQEERDLLEQRVQERTRDLANARDQALSASHYKSELMARVSHELRTPLGAILGYSELLKRGALGPLAPKQQQVMEDVLDSTNHLTELINDLLDQSYIESGNIQISNQPFAIQKIRDQALAFKIKAESKNLRYTVRLDPDLPNLILGDEKRVRQILNNLISNAIKFTEHGEVHVSFAANGAQNWMIEVRDTGPGIPREVQSRVFDPFWQLDTSITRSKEGYGLGLSIVKQITELIGGEVSLQSEPGQGSTFRVILPLCIPAQGPA
ncbi:MAG TPA: ATP-binding protein [Anaerolineaceae bacterium]|nr:ATP-binding protein [Anaerolineaceae bacterium]